MKRSYLPLLLSLGLTLGYGTGQLLRKASQRCDPPASEAAVESPGQSVYETKKELWRKRFLSLLQEPSRTLQTVSYYALAKDISTDDIPYLLEGMYPEGWVRFREDLPLALFMEWAKQDSPGLAIFSERLHLQYPDLKDNLEGIFFNLGLQNAPGAIETLEEISNELTRRLLVSRYIDGLRDQHPNALFAARLRLLGPENAFSNISHEELEYALQEFWGNSSRYLKPKTTLDPILLVELGKRYNQKGIQVLSTSRNIGIVIIGSIASSGTASAETMQTLNASWVNWHPIDKFLNDAEKHSVLSFLSTQESFWQRSQSAVSTRLLSSALDRELVDKLVEVPGLPQWTRNHILSRAADFYPEAEYLQFLSRFDKPARNTGINSLLSSKTSQESLDFLQDLKPEWQNEDFINVTFDKAVLEGSSATLQKIRSQFPDHQSYLPRGEKASAALWQLDPELYLRNIESLPSHQKGHHLEVIASVAAAEELGVILESGTFDQQTDVLISLIHENPILGTEILKHEDPSHIDARQASELGVSLAYNAGPEIAYSFFNARDISQESSQLAVLTYYLSEAMMEKPNGAAAKIALLSPKHDYLYRAAIAFNEETNSTEDLIELRQEDPKTFIKALTSLIGKQRGTSLQQRAQKLLTSPILSNQEKRDIHHALYGRRGS